MSSEFTIIKQIYKRIYLKAEQFKQITLGNIHFLKFLEKITEFEEFCEGISSTRILQEINLSTFNCQYKYLTSEKYKAIEFFENTKKKIEFSDIHELYDTIINGNKEYVEYLIHSYNKFATNIRVFSYKLNNLSIITDIDDKLYYLKDIYQVVIKNQRNIEKSLQLHQVREFLEKHLENLIKQTNFQYNQATKNCPNLKMSHEPSQHSSEIYYDRIRNELLKQKQNLEIRQSELIQLKNELFHGEQNLQTQKTTATMHLQNKEDDLKIRIKSIEALESNILDMENEMVQISAKTEIAKKILSEKKDELSNGLNEMCRIEKLIEEINEEIELKMLTFKNETENMEKKRQEILMDPNLTMEEKQTLIKKLDEEIQNAEEEQVNGLSILIAERDNLKTQSENNAANLHIIGVDIQAKHLKELEELKKLKIGASPSEIEIINMQILALNKNFEHDLNLIDKASSNKEYFSNENGRYYINDEGIKIFQRHSNASENILNDDGTWIKLNPNIENNILMDIQAKHIKELEELKKLKIGASPSEIEIINMQILALNKNFEHDLNLIDKANSNKEYFSNENGRYYINDEGIKIFQRHSNASENILNDDGTWIKLNPNIENNILMDKHGKYYIDENGLRIYKTNSIASEYILIDGELVKVRDKEDLNDASGISSSETSLEVEQKADQEYLKRVLGVPLRLALASLTLKQPSSPITYLANYLLQYRYNEKLNCKKQQELQNLLEERERIQQIEQTVKKNKERRDFCNPCEKFNVLVEE